MWLPVRKRATRRATGSRQEGRRHENAWRPIILPAPRVCVPAESSAIACHRATASNAIGLICDPHGRAPSICFAKKRTASAIHPSARVPVIVYRPTACYDSAVPKLLSVMQYAWAAPTTALGVVLVLAGLWRAHVRVVDGVIEAHGPTLAWLLSHLTLIPGGAAALTLGHVVVGRDLLSLESTRAHERVHVRQCEIWGPLFVPAYLSASLWAGVRGRDLYRDNPFEIEAFTSAGC